jgi:hypothetical protein
MEIIESQFTGGMQGKKDCDFCCEESENGVLVEKPNSMIINGQLIVSHRNRPLYICLDCLKEEAENI